MNISQLSAHAVLDPSGTRKIILDALEAADGHRSRAAADLGVSPKSFYDVVRRLDGLLEQIEKRWPAGGRTEGNGGPPPKPKPKKTRSRKPLEASR